MIQHHNVPAFYAPAPSQRVHHSNIIRGKIVLQLEDTYRHFTVCPIRNFNIKLRDGASPFMGSRVKLSYDIH